MIEKLSANSSSNASTKSPNTTGISNLPFISIKALRTEPPWLYPLETTNPRQNNRFFLDPVNHQY
jgi:hypothetical protein